MFSTQHELDAELAQSRFDVRAIREQQHADLMNDKKQARQRRAGTAFLGTSLIAATAFTLLFMRLLVLFIEAYTLIQTERKK